jgi:hypothetical protein
VFRSLYKIKKHKSLFEKGVGKTPCKREGKGERGGREPKGKEDQGKGGQQ